MLFHDIFGFSFCETACEKLKNANLLKAIILKFVLYSGAVNSYEKHIMNYSMHPELL